MSASLFDNAVNYVKNNPIETALTVASVIPAVRIGKFAYTAGKTLFNYGVKAYKTRPVNLYRGVHPIPKDQTLSKAKEIVKFHRVDAKLNNYANTTYGNWFTSSKKVATNYSQQKGIGGSVLKVKVPHNTLMKLKNVQPPISKPVTKMNENSREFFGVVPASIRRLAKKL